MPVLWQHQHCAVVSPTPRAVLSCSSEHGRMIFKRHSNPKSSLRSKMTTLYVQTTPDFPAISELTVRRILIKFSIGVCLQVVEQA